MVKELTLKNGTKIPQLGLGTWRLSGRECTEAVKKALEIGYRHIDTAEMYGNHKDIGKAIKDFDSEELFITSKVWHTNLRHDDVLQACEETLSDLGTDYLNLYLIHWPNTGVPVKETLGALKELYDEGKIRAVGVSNFTIPLLKEALEVSEVPIVMNQVEFHPYLYQEELYEFCNDNDVKITAYSPLARGKVLQSGELKEIGENHGKSAAQVSLRWLLDKGIVAIPKSGTESHIKSNFDVFDFSLKEGEIEEIDALGSDNRLVRPSFAEF